MTRCALRRCKWARDGHCFVMLGNWCPNQKARAAAENALWIAEQAEFIDMLKRVSIEKQHTYRRKKKEDTDG